MVDYSYPLDLTLDETELDVTRSAILAVLNTELGELPLQPQYGIEPGILSSDNTGKFLASIEKTIREVIPYGDFRVLGLRTEQGWAIEVIYDALTVELVLPLS